MTPLALRLAVRALPTDVRDEVLRELLEQHAEIRRARGASAASWWAWRQVPITWSDRRQLRPHAASGAWLSEVRASFQGLRRRPGLAVTVIATIAVSVGAIAAIASVIDAVLLRPIPLPQPDQLVWVSSYEQAPGAEPFDRRDATSGYANPMDVVDWAARQRRLSAMAPFETTDLTIEIADRPVRAHAARVGAGFTGVIRSQPLYGRLFNETDQTPAPRTAVLSYPFWRAVFGGDPSVVGRTIMMSGSPVEVIGVLPDLGLRFPERDTDLWVPLPPLPAGFANRGGVWQRVVGRLAADASVTDAERDMERVARELAAEYPKTNTDRHIAVVPLRDALVGDSAEMLWLLGGAVALVLVIGCANVGHLLLVSAQARRREFAVRAALGAAPGRIARLLTAESLWLALAGGAAGLVIGGLLLKAFVLLYPEPLPAVGDIALSRTAVIASLVAVALSALLAVAPSVAQTRSRHLQYSLRGGERGSTDGSQRRLRGALVITQVALSTTLLACGGLLLRTYLTMQRVDPGFAPGADSTLTFNLSLNEQRYPTLDSEVRFYDALIDTLQSRPGVAAVGTTTLLPLSPGEFGDGFFRVGFNDAAPDIPIARLQNVTPGYFNAIGLRLIRGRLIGAGDTAGAPRAVVVNEALERRYFPDGAIGHRIIFRGVEREVVGIVADKHHRSLRDTPRPEMFYPRTQSSHPRLFAWVAVRTTGDAMRMLPDVRAAVAALDPTVAVDDAQLMRTRVNRALAPDRFRAALIMALAVVALLLAALGLYGLIAHAVARETRDIAIRMALGAGQGRAVRRVLRNVAALSAAGLVAGLGAAWLARGWLESFLFGVTPEDPLTLTGVAALLMLVSVAAALGPALRASRIDPATELRS
jgi:putative ABC transport system permease protein